MLRELERYLLKSILYLDLKVYTVICVKRLVSNISYISYLFRSIDKELYLYWYFTLLPKCEDCRYSPTCAHLKYIFTCVSIIRSTRKKVFVISTLSNLR